MYFKVNFNLFFLISKSAFLGEKTLHTVKIFGSYLMAQTKSEYSQADTLV